MMVVHRYYIPTKNTVDCLKCYPHRNINAQRVATGTGTYLSNESAQFTNRVLSRRPHDDPHNQLDFVVTPVTQRFLRN